MDLTTEKVGTLADIVRRCDDGSDVYEVAAAVLAHAKAIGVLMPIVADEVRRIRRASVRAVEATYFGSPADPVAARKQLLAEAFYVPGMGMVEWGEATAEQHESAAAELRSKAAALEVTALRHEASAQEIRKARARCLNQIKRRRRAS